MTETPVPGAVPRYELQEWRERHRVVAGITARGSDGAPFDLGLGGTTRPVGQVISAWRAFRSAVPEFSGVIVSRQVHGVDVAWHDSAQGLVILGNGDGHATGSSGILLTVTAADCVPVYLLDPVGRRVALVHAGWRGTANGIVGRAIAMLTDRGSHVDNLLMHCGVGICGACYEVGSEVFHGCGVPEPAGGRGLLDLRGVLKNQAMELGVESVSTSDFCSKHDFPVFFSHRASRGADGRMVAYLGLLP